MTYHAVGKPIGRVEGPTKVTGAATYSADIRLPAMLWGKALRSPWPHARIVRIDTSAAERLPGVLAVLTAKDLSGPAHLAPCIRYDGPCQRPRPLHWREGGSRGGGESRPGGGCLGLIDVRL